MGESDAYNEFFDEARLPESTRRCVRRFYPTLGALLDVMTVLSRSDLKKDICKELQAEC